VYMYIGLLCSAHSRCRRSKIAKSCYWEGNFPCS